MVYSLLLIPAVLWTNCKLFTDNCFYTKVKLFTWWVLLYSKSCVQESLRIKTLIRHPFFLKFDNPVFVFLLEIFSRFLRVHSFFARQLKFYRFSFFVRLGNFLSSDHVASLSNGEYYAPVCIKYYFLSPLMSEKTLRYIFVQSFSQSNNNILYNNQSENMHKCKVYGDVIILCATVLVLFAVESAFFFPAIFPTSEWQPSKLAHFKFHHYYQFFSFKIFIMCLAVDFLEFVQVWLAAFTIILQHFLSFIVWLFMVFLITFILALIVKRVTRGGRRRAIRLPELSV